MSFLLKASKPLARLSPSSTSLRNGIRPLSTTPSRMTSSNKSAAGEAISEVAKAEGGTTKGSQSAKMQSELTKAMNDHSSDSQEAQGKVAEALRPKAESNQSSTSTTDEISQVSAQLHNAPESITKTQADHIQSVESRAQGGGRPPKGGIAAQAMSAAMKNDNSSSGSPPSHSNTSASDLSRGEKSQSDREANFRQAEEKIGAKLGNDPESVTKEDAAYVHSREERAFGKSEKGGVASRAHRVADGNA